MDYGVYSVRDSLVGYGFPIIMSNDAVAMREFVNSHKDVGSPQDYSLWNIGVFNTDTGVITSDVVPSCICNLIDCLKGEKDG